MSVQSYWTNTYQFEDSARITAIQLPDDTKGELMVEMDRTIMHPQGGGQPSDVGVIFSTKGRLNVKRVVKVERDNKVYIQHFGDLEGEPFAVGDEVEVKVSEAERRLNARLHSAGHLLDIAVAKAGFPLHAAKGNHFPGSPYVEYQGELTAQQRSDFQAAVQAQVDALIQQDIEVSAKVIEYKDVEEACGSIPAYLPKDQPVRVVRVAGEAGCPCGGTHVQSTGQIGKLTITKLEKKGKVYRVKYQVN